MGPGLRQSAQHVGGVGQQAPGLLVRAGPPFVLGGGCARAWPGGVGLFVRAGSPLVTGAGARHRVNLTLPIAQAEFNALAGELARAYPDRARLWFAYDEPLSHLIYAGADMLLVPSMFEPCGLTQMIAMRRALYPALPCTPCTLRLPARLPRAPAQLQFPRPARCRAPAPCIAAARRR